MLLSEGKGGFSDFHAYRKTMTEWFFEGKQPELTEEQKAEQTARVSGVAPPTSAMEELRQMHERAKLNQPKLA